MLAPPIDLDLEVARAHARPDARARASRPTRSARMRPRQGPRWRGRPAPAAGCGRVRRGRRGGRNGRRRPGGDRRRDGGGRARPRGATARRRTGGRASGGALRRRRRANRRGWSRRGRSRSRLPGSRPAPPCPTCRSAGGRTVRRRRGRCRRGGWGRRRAAGPATPGQPSSDACGSQSKVSVSPLRRTTRVSARQEREECVEEGRLPDLARFRGDDRRGRAPRPGARVWPPDRCRGCPRGSGSRSNVRRASWARPRAYGRRRDAVKSRSKPVHRTMPADDRRCRTAPPSCRSPRTASPMSRRCSSRAATPMVLVRLLPVPRPRLDELDRGGEQGRPRGADGAAARAGAPRLPGRPTRRLGQPRAAR